MGGSVVEFSKEVNRNWATEKPWGVLNRENLMSKGKEVREKNKAFMNNYEWVHLM